MKTHTGRKQLKYFVETANFSLFFFSVWPHWLRPHSSTNGSPVAIKSVLGSHSELVSVSLASTKVSL